ncbi:hypothetical protein Y032_0137g2035 [Ancylostoma ceylanicum]|uniref:Uncharacterized protein n=1 Tax=Ancylostoma ceylanicum TaxID=53326 RepID=A0A016T540_9BILA|nr:hypothetical protein Y032_0137g2035 [Ancylostoma ceylanicum]
MKILHGSLDMSLAYCFGSDRTHTFLATLRLLGVYFSGRVWRSGKRLAAHAHGRWFDRAPTANQAVHPSGVGKLVPEESGRMKH